MNKALLLPSTKDFIGKLARDLMGKHRPEDDGSAREHFISVVVCTRNRAGKLIEFLAAMSDAFNQRGELGAELIIIDDGSIDDTRAILDDWLHVQSFDLLVESTCGLGLAGARNKAVALARGALLAFTDDDCIVEPDYLSAIAKSFEGRATKTIVGGRIELGDPNDLPVTIKTNVAASKLLPGQSPGGYIMGANMVIPRFVYDDVGLFDTRFGAGGRYLSAEDTEYVFRAVSVGVEIRYDPSLVVHHFHGRRHQVEIRKLEYGYCFGEGAMLAKHFYGSSYARKLLAKNVFWWLRDTAIRTYRFKNGDVVRPSRKLAIMLRGFVSYSFSAVIGEATASRR